MVVLAFPAHAISPCELDYQNLTGHNARMRVGACGVILLPLTQSLHDFVRGIEVKDVV